MILAVDVGNSRTKWGVFDPDGTLLGRGGVENASLAQLEASWRHLAGIGRAVVSCVASAELSGGLTGIFAALGLPVTWVGSSASACGVVNHYRQPRQLGPDRWAALVAAWNLYHAPCVVATAGTALTVDALNSQGEFLGGLIVPGLAMLCEAMAQGTAAGISAEGALSDFPVTTADAAYSGIVVALAGAVERQCRLLEAREGSVPLCLIGGGGMESLADALNRPTTLAPDLVLHGLYILEKTYR